MSSESTVVSRMTSALSEVAESAKVPDSATGGWTSKRRRWSVQSPAFATSVGTPGSGTIDPNAPPDPAKLNPVM
jgi:hypothetical protein